MKYKIVLLKPSAAGIYQPSKGYRIHSVLQDFGDCIKVLLEEVNG